MAWQNIITVDSLDYDLIGLYFIIMQRRGAWLPMLFATTAVKRLKHL